MIRFWAIHIIDGLEELSRCMRMLSDRPPAEPISDADAEVLHNGVVAMEAALRVMGDTNGKREIRKIRSILELAGDRNRVPSIFANQTLKEKIREAKVAIKIDLETHFFTHIPQPLAIYFEQDRLLGDSVFNSFPSARDEIKQAGNCLAAELYTAAVFHLMRVMTIGERELARHLDVTKIGNKDLEYCRDQQIHDEIDSAIETKLDEIQQGIHDAKWESNNAYYKRLRRDLDYFKDIDRDPAFHARKNYGDKGALDVYEKVKDFMVRLAERVRE